LTELGQACAATRAQAAAAIAGDRNALRAVWEAERRWLAAVLLVYKPNDVELDDLLQEVAMTLVRNIGQLRDPERLRPWLRTTAINAARAMARSGRVRSQMRLTLSQRRPSAAPPPDQADAHDDEPQRVLRLAGQLPEAYREPLLLRAVRGLPPRQIADILDLPKTTIETRLARGRTMLRELAAASDAAVRRGGEESGIGSAAGSQAAASTGGART
jgi:RNA polymerase sigma-70 factor (ECF subfamily)